MWLGLGVNNSALRLCDSVNCGIWEATGLLTGAGPYLRRAFAKPNYQLLLNCYQPNTTALHCALPTQQSNPHKHAISPNTTWASRRGAVKLPVSLVNFKSISLLPISPVWSKEV
ncbi:uncharacterized protein LAJ45_04994 [Morchella importuna]|uniref:uncharacterized protein n=1 Tax=Morchella importuna TaxID=1174673 RepID=UPI001E8EC80B|nr:uncharacterized protein LAJ45_04994 [Morchella importuna]KAH8150813.1 hypothetical protein LAJ45_04994 [Morchella importuna]